MIVLINDIAAYTFSSALDKLVFTTNQDWADLTLSCDGVTILSERYTPDISGTISIVDLQDIVQPYLVKNLIDSFSYHISDGVSTVDKTFVVQFCSAESSMQATEFLGRYFLTTLMGDKVTSFGRKEFLHFVSTEESDVSVDCVYWNAGSIVNKNKSLGSYSQLNRVVTIEVSPDLFMLADHELVSYVVRVGARVQSYTLDSRAVDAAPILMFTNSFGCQETIYCTGTHALEPEFSRSTAYINGMFRNYLIEENKVFKANTGLLTPAMALWADDLFRSCEIYFLDGDKQGKEITITTSESKRNNDLDNLISFTFEYRYSQRNHNILQLPRAGRIFDYTFDNTFE